MDPISVIVVDDIPLMRQAITSFVERDPQFVLVGEASNGEEAVALANELQPSVFLMDLQMPVMDGIQATRRILDAHPDTKIIAITTFYTDSYVIPALRAGVHGYILKHSRPEEITDAIRSAFEGKSIISSEALETLNISLNKPSVQPNLALWSTFTHTEQKIISAVCQGMSNKDIATHLHFAESTVKSNLTHIMQKMGVNSRLEVVVTALHSALPVDDPLQ